MVIPIENSLYICFPIKLKLSSVLRSIYDVCFSPDGVQLIVAAGQIVSVYDCQNGSIIQTLKGKNCIFSFTYYFSCLH